MTSTNQVLGHSGPMMHAHQDTENSVIGYFQVTKAFDGVARPYEAQ